MQLKIIIFRKFYFIYNQVIVSNCVTCAKSRTCIVNGTSMHREYGSFSCIEMSLMLLPFQDVTKSKFYISLNVFFFFFNFLTSNEKSEVRTNNKYRIISNKIQYYIFIIRKKV